MATRTGSVLSALGGEGALDVVLLLLRRAGGATVREIVEESELSQATVTRRLQDLEASGLAEHSGRLQPFRLREVDSVKKLLRAASDLSTRVLALDIEDEAEFRRSLD